MVNRIFNRFVKICNGSDSNDWNSKKINGFLKLCIFSVRVFVLLFLVFSITNKNVVLSLSEYEITFQMISLTVLLCLILSIDTINKLLCSLLMKLVDESKSQVTVDTVTVDDIRLYVKKNNINL